jgi:hypothetical protein
MRRVGDAKIGVPYGTTGPYYVRTVPYGTVGSHNQYYMVFPNMLKCCTPNVLMICCSFELCILHHNSTWTVHHCVLGLL